MNQNNEDVGALIMKRKWAMPSGNTFSVKPIGEFVQRYIAMKHGMSVDPFANTNRLADVTNDLDPAMGCVYSMDALDFLKGLETGSVGLLLFDPPYSPRQVSECYKKLGRTVDMKTTQASFWSNLKDEAARIIAPGGVCLCFGWTSQGLGKGRGFVMEEILLVAHGGHHNDTICTAERRIAQNPT